jgi:hypothetical protein
LSFSKPPFEPENIVFGKLKKGVDLAHNHCFHLSMSPNIGSHQIFSLLKGPSCKGYQVVPFHKNILVKLAGHCYKGYTKGK